MTTKDLFKKGNSIVVLKDFQTEYNDTWIEAGKVFQLDKDIDFYSFNGGNEINDPYCLEILNPQDFDDMNWLKLGSALPVVTPSKANAKVATETTDEYEAGKIYPMGTNIAHFVYVYDENYGFTVDELKESKENNSDEIDEDIQELISLFNKKGMKTKFSCSGHEGGNEEFYIMFDNEVNYLKLLDWHKDFTKANVHRTGSLTLNNWFRWNKTEYVSNWVLKYLRTDEKLKKELFLDIETSLKLIKEEEYNDNNEI